MIRYLTAGESHGRCLIGILEGLPAGLKISEEEIARDLRRRQMGYGRGDRMKIEQDRAQILAGVRYGRTLGSPLALQIENRDWPNWQETMRVEEPPESERVPDLTRPRPGHADLAGAVKYGHRDIRNVIERSSARETAMRVALGALCRKLLSEIGVGVASHVIGIGGERSEDDAGGLSTDEINARADNSPVHCLTSDAERGMMEAIDRAASNRDTVGGEFEVVIDGLPRGIGSYAHADRRLDGLLGGALLSIPAIKSAGVGVGSRAGDLPGSEMHDRIAASGEKPMPVRPTNRAGGIEGGVTNGERVVVRATMKPLSTLGRPLESIDMATGEPSPALSERSDVCAVPAAAIVGEAVVMLALVNPLLEKLGGDSMTEILAHLRSHTGSPWD